MRVTNTNMYRKYATAVNDVHDKLNKSMNKISSGAAYEAGADNPLAYYQGKKMDHQFQDAESKLQLMTDVQNRIYQQELGARSVQKTLSEAKSKDIEFILNGTNTPNETTVGTMHASLIQKQQSMINDLNAQYEDFYVYGGNDLSTAPFTMNSDGTKLTFNHKFPGDPNVTTVVLNMVKDGDGYGFEVDAAASKDGRKDPQVSLSESDALEAIKKAMTEHGYVDIGYGTIDDTSTLLDTFTGGFNVLTGVNASEASKANFDVLGALNNSSVGLVGKAIAASKDYLDGNMPMGDYTKYLGQVMDDMAVAEHKISTVYSDLGTKYALIDTTEDKLKSLQDGLKEQYKDKLGADPYEAIMEMFSYQYSYTASLQLSSKLMESSLFNFIS